MKHAWLIFCVGLWSCLPNNIYAENIAILKSAEIGAYADTIHAFKQSLPPSHHVVSEYDLRGDLTKGRHLARSIHTSNANIVLAVGLKAALVAKREILDIPVIICLVLDPKKYDLPTKSMVGLSLQIPFEQKLKTTSNLNPATIQKRGAIRSTKNSRLPTPTRTTCQSVWADPRFPESPFRARGAQCFEIPHKESRCSVFLPDSMVMTEHSLDFLISSTLEANIPLIGFSTGLVRNGAVISVYVDYTNIGQQAATLISTVLTTKTSQFFGTMVPPGVISQAINVKSAQYLGISLMPNILRSFDEHY